MKYFITSVLVFSLCLHSFGQRISKVSLTASGTTEMIAIQTDDAVINLSPEGVVINYGVEYISERLTNYSRIEPFNGRIDMFTNFDDKEFRGKLKYLGKTPVTYYASYDQEGLRGKVKTIGGLGISYYMPYEDEALRGKIKSIGNTALGYFSAFDNVALKGKLKTLGITELNYYSSFEDKAIRGKIKSIGQVSFTFYTSFDTRYVGSMKTGSQLQNVNGVYYFIKL
ncbi:MAG: hypothetical protein WKF88_02240 [Ferruginibacter sp.]